MSLVSPSTLQESEAVVGQDGPQTKGYTGIQLISTRNLHRECNGVFGTSTGVIRINGERYKIICIVDDIVLFGNNDDELQEALDKTNIILRV